MKKIIIISLWISAMIRPMESEQPKRIEMLSQQFQESAIELTPAAQLRMENNKNTCCTQCKQTCATSWANCNRRCSSSSTELEDCCYEPHPYPCAANTFYIGLCLFLTGGTATGISTLWWPCCS